MLVLRTLEFRVLVFVVNITLDMSLMYIRFVILSWVSMPRSRTSRFMSLLDSRLYLYDDLGKFWMIMTESGVDPDAITKSLHCRVTEIVEWAAL
jgi:hypothetical protein